MGLGNHRFTLRNHHRGQAHQHVRSRRQDDWRRTNRTHRVGALPQSHPGLLWHTGWVPARTPTVHQCLCGGRPWVAHNKLYTQHQNDKTRVYRTTPWLPTFEVTCCSEKTYLFFFAVFLMLVGFVFLGGVCICVKFGHF